MSDFKLDCATKAFDFYPGQSRYFMVRLLHDTREALRFQIMSRKKLTLKAKHYVMDSIVFS